MRIQGTRGSKASIYFAITGIAIAVFGVSNAFSVPTLFNVEPAKSHVIVKQGTLAGYKWWVTTHREDGHSAGRRPCLDVSIGRKPVRLGDVPINSICGAVEPIPNVIGVSAGPMVGERSVFAMAFGLRARRAVVDLGPRGRRSLSLVKLSDKRAQDARIEPFRFAVIALAGPFCVRRIMTYDHRGAKVSDGGPTGCG